MQLGYECWKKEALGKIRGNLDRGSFKRKKGRFVGHWGLRGTQMGSGWKKKSLRGASEANGQNESWKKKRFFRERPERIAENCDKTGPCKIGKGSWRGIRGVDG